MGFWRSALLKCGKLKDFQGAKPLSYSFLLTCLLHTQYFSSSSNITATFLITFGVSQPRRVTVVPPASPPTVPPRGPVLHLSCSPTSSRVPRSGFSIHGWLLGNYLAQAFQDRQWHGLLQSNQCDFSLCVSPEPLWKNERKILEGQDTEQVGDIYLGLKSGHSNVERILTCTERQGEIIREITLSITL